MNNNLTLNSSIIQNEDVLFNILLTIDHIFRYTSVLIHLVYLTVLIFSKDLHKRTMLFINHATLTNSIYCIITFYFIFGDRPNFNDQTVNNIICSIIEIGWIFATYIRMYSILLISVYRYLAVFKLKLYKKLNGSRLAMWSLLFTLWIISIGMPLFAKYMFQTTTSSVLCLDGFSTSFSNTLMYFFFNYGFMILGPSVVIVYIYATIIKKLRALCGSFEPSKSTKPSNKVFKIEIQENGSTNYTTSETNQVLPRVGTIQNYGEFRNAKKQKRFANQFFFMCLSVIASSIVLSIFTLRNVIPNFLNVFYYWRPVLRIYILSAISIVPLLSLYYHPSKIKFCSCGKIFTIG